jgi:hypothetical protein
MNGKKTILIISMLGLIVLLCAPSVLAWNINPARWVLYHKDDYELTPYVWEMELENTADAPMVVKLSVMQPEYLYNGTNGMPVTTALPDLSLVTINKTELRMGAHEKQRVTVDINLLNVSENYNQSFEFWIFADQTEGAGNIQTDYNCRWVVQTPTRWVPYDQRAGYVAPWIMPLVVIVVVGVIVAFALILKMPSRRPIAQANGNKAIRAQKHKEQPKREVVVEKQKPSKLVNKNNGSTLIKYKKQR